MMHGPIYIKHTDRSLLHIYNLNTSTNSLYMNFNVNTILTIWDPIVCALNVPGLCFHIWTDDGSFEPKYVAEFSILITLYTVVLLTGIIIMLLQYTTE